MKLRKLTHMVSFIFPAEQNPAEAEEKTRDLSRVHVRSLLRRRINYEKS